MNDYDIAVVGGGMVGAALALALGRAGWSVAVIEASPLPLWEAGEEYDLRVSAINRASQNLLTHLGAWEGILRRRASPYRRMRVWDAGSDGEIVFDALELQEPDLGHIIENRVILTALLEVMQRMENVRLLAPVGLSGIEFRPAEVRLSLSDRTRLHARLVVGADGARSLVRELAGIRRTRRDYGQTAIVATVATESPHHATAWQRFRPTCPLAVLPLGDGRSSIVWSTRNQEAERLLSLDDDAFREALAAAFEHRLGAVLEVGPRAAFPLVGGQSYPYVRPRVALVGDAAHSIHPLAGQGVNLGFMDAAELAAALAGRRRDPGALQRLRRYERARRGENEAVMRLMEAFRSLFGLPAPPLARMRGAGMRLVGGIAPLKRRIMAQALGVAGPRPPLASTPQDRAH